MIMLLSGTSGSGKTSTCAIAAKSAREHGISVGGIVCRAVFEQGLKVGIEFSDLAANPARPPCMLARIRHDVPGSASGATLSLAGTPSTPGFPAFDDSDARILRYGKWEFSKAALAAADQAIIQSLADFSHTENKRSSIIFVDEIGPLELDRSTGLVKTLALINKTARLRRTDLQLLVVARPDIAARLMALWPDSALLEMEGTDYGETAQAIITAFRQAASKNT